MKTAPVAVALLSLLFFSCDKQLNTSSPDEKVRALEAELAKLKGTSNQPAQKKAGELTRDLATSLLNEYLAKSPVTKIQFVNDEDARPVGYQKASTDGLIDQHDPPSFTAKGIALGGSVFLREIHTINGRGNWFHFEVLLSKGVKEKVSEVTGIAPGQNPNFCDVEFVTAYSIPENAKGMLKYIYSGQKSKWNFRRYDDGWRIER